MTHGRRAFDATARSLKDKVLLHVVSEPLALSSQCRQPPYPPPVFALSLPNCPFSRNVHQMGSRRRVSWKAYCPVVTTLVEVLWRTTRLLVSEQYELTNDTLVAQR